MKKILLIFSALLFLVPSIAFASDYYADPSGSGTTCGDGTECTIEYCIESKASSGDTCHLNDGTYVTASLEIPVGVSVQGRNSDETLVTINPSSNDSSNPFISFYSASPGTSGSQSLSYVTVDGTATYNFTHGIRVVNRNNVSISHVDIRDFTGSGGTASSLGVGGGSYGLYVRSTEQSQNASWWNYFNYLGEKTGSWSTNPVENFSYSYGNMDHCGYGDDPETSRTFCPAVYTWDLKTFTFNYLNIDVSHSNTQAFYATTALLEDGSFHHLVLTGNSTGQINGDSEGLFLIEIWDLVNVDLYNNKLIRGGISIIASKDTNIYNNYIDWSSATNSRGMAIEMLLGINGQIYRNRIKGSPSAGGEYGISCGPGPGGRINSGGVGITHTQYVWGNYIFDSRRDGIRAYSDARTNSYTCTIYLMHNFIDNCSSGYSDYAGVWMEQGDSYGKLNIIGRNNIVTNNANGLKAYNSIDSTDFQYNANVNNWNNNVSGTVSVSNGIGTEPTYEDYANDDFDLTVGSSGIYSGTSLGLPFDVGINPSTTNWASGTTLPTVYTALHSTQDTNPSLGPAVYLSAADVTGPVVSSVTPNSELSAGTTSTGFSATSNDAAGTTVGVKWSTSNVPYASMENTASGSGDGTYTDTITDLTDDTQYHYYGAAIDDSDNITYFDIIFSVSIATTNTLCDDADACYSETGTGWASAYRPGDAWNDNHRYSNTADDTVTFSFSGLTPGNYLIEAWIFDGYHDTACLTTINDVGGPSNTTFNMNGADGGEWTTIGVYALGTSATVKYTVQSAYVIPDAVRLSYQNSGARGTAVTGCSLH